MELNSDSVVNSLAKLDESSAFELVVDWVKLADNSSDDETLMKLDSNSAVLDNSSVEIGLLAHEPMELDEEVPILEDSWVEVDNSIEELLVSEVILVSKTEVVADGTELPDSILKIVVDGSRDGVSTGFGAVAGGTNVSLPVNVVAKSWSEQVTIVSVKTIVSVCVNTTTSPLIVDFVVITFVTVLVLGTWVKV